VSNAHLSQVRRVKPLGKPRIDLGEELSGFSSLPLLLPQMAEAHGRTQLPRFGLLATSNGQGLLQTGFRVGRVCNRLLQQAFALEPIYLRQHIGPPARLKRAQRLGQQVQRFCRKV
jgi:hypothetical protein